MQKKWVENNTKFLNHVGTNFGPIVTASIEAKELVVTKVDPDELPMLKTKKEETEYIATLVVGGRNCSNKPKIFTSSLAHLSGRT